MYHALASPPLPSPSLASLLLQLIEQLLDDRVRQMGAVDVSPGPSAFAPAFSGGGGGFPMVRSGSSLFKEKFAENFAFSRGPNA